MTIILTAALSKSLRSTECKSSTLNIQKQCLRSSLPTQQDHGVSIQYHAKQWHKECQPELGSQHQYLISWITHLARALLRAALTENQHFSSEVVTKAQHADISERISKSRCKWRNTWKGFCETISGNWSSRIRHYLPPILCLLIIQLCQI